LLDPVDGEPLSYAPHEWKARQYSDGTAAERAKRHRDRKRDANGRVTRDDRDSTVAVTALEQNRREKNRSAAVTPLVEVTDEDAQSVGCVRLRHAGQALSTQPPRWMVFPDTVATHPQG